MSDSEYSNLLSEFTSAVESELLAYVRGLILYGSYQKEQDKGPGWIVPGTSDLDLVLIIDVDDINPKKPAKRFAKIAETLSVFFVHPVYAPILDLRLLEYHDLPAKLGMAFSPVHAESTARYGEVILGNNVLENFTYSEKQLNRCTKIAINQAYESLKSGYLQRVVIGEQPLTYEFADLMLDIAHPVSELKFFELCIIDNCSSMPFRSAPTRGATSFVISCTHQHPLYLFRLFFILREVRLHVSRVP